jgi:tripartite-type tricarboxylate transporter receptor subunit TctC
MTSRITRRVAAPGQTSASRRRALASIAALAAATAAPSARAQAQAWPAGKQVRLVLPSGAGGGADIFARFMADGLSKELGAQFIVENRPGATGLLAAGEVARAAPDGHTLLVSFTAATVANKLLMLKPAVDPIGFTPIGRIGGGGGNMIIVNPELPVKNMAELIAYAKSKPGLSYASWGVGSGGHLVMEHLKKQTGMELNHVPYKTVAQIPPDVISGVIPVATIDSASPLPHIRSGRVRAIAAISQTRLPQIPDVPTLPQQGLILEAQSWYGLFGPLGMPDDVTLRINTVLNRWILQPETVAFFADKQNGPPPIPTTPAEFRQVIEKDLVSWKGLIDAAGVQPQ